LLFALACSISLAAESQPGVLREFKVELPAELRTLAGRGQTSPVTHALVTIVAPANFDAARDWPVLIVNATSVPQYRSSRTLLRAYAEAAVAHGWIALAADPGEEVTVDQDDAALRYALDKAALGALEAQWPGANRARLAFAGFSAGAKYSGWLAAAFASEGRTITGMYLAGINEDTVLSAARQFKVQSDAYRRVPVFLLSGETDEIATMADHRRILDELRRAGFSNVRIEYFAGPHVVDPCPLRIALDWFLDVARQTTSSR
jgi:predicted esterase